MNSLSTSTHGNMYNIIIYYSTQVLHHLKHVCYFIDGKNEFNIYLEQSLSLLTKTWKYGGMNLIQRLLEKPKCCGDTMTFESLQLTPFYLEKTSVRKRYFNVFAAFQIRMRLE